MSNQIPRVLEEHSINEKYLLEEYRDQGFCWRNDDGAFSRLTAVLIPLSIAALTLPYLRSGTPKLLAASGGLLLMTFWVLSSELHTRRLKIRFSRLHEIEWILGFNSHLKYHREVNQKVWRFQILRRYMFVAYLLIAFCVTCDMKGAVISWPLDWGIIKSVITTETTAFLLVVFILIIPIAVCICWILSRRGWRRYKRCRYDKRLTRRPKGA